MAATPVASPVKSMAAREAVGGGVELDLMVEHHGEDGPEDAFGSFAFGATDAKALGHALRVLGGRETLSDIERLRVEHESIGKALEILTGGG